MLVTDQLIQNPVSRSQIVWDWVMKRRVMGGVILAARMVGAMLAALGALSFVLMRFWGGGIANAFGMISALALVFAGVGSLVAVQVLLHFFDQFLSRN